MIITKIATTLSIHLKIIRAMYRKDIHSIRLLIPLACDADLCAIYPAAQKIREKMPVKTAREIHMEIQRTPG